MNEKASERGKLNGRQILFTSRCGKIAIVDRCNYYRSDFYVFTESMQLQSDEFSRHDSFSYVLIYKKKKKNYRIKKHIFKVKDTVLCKTMCFNG